MDNNWRLGTLSTQSATNHRNNFDRWRSHVAYFDEVVSFLLADGWIPPLVNAQARRAAEERVATWQNLVWVPPGSESYLDRIFEDEPKSDVEAQSIGLHYAAVGVVRSLAMSGFHAFSDLVHEASAAHRRTIEGVRHVDILLHKPELAIHYWRAADKRTRSEQAAGEFKKAVDEHWGLIANPRHPESRLSPLQRKLRPRASDGLLNLGAHAGLAHLLTCYTRPNESDFFDIGFKYIGTLAWRFATETIQLLDAITNDCGWIDRTKWRRRFDALIAQARGLELEDRRLTGQQDFSNCPWTTLTDAR